MKRILCAIAVATALSPTASMANELIVGVKAGIHSLDNKNYDPAPMLSAQISYEFLDVIAADFALEIEAGTTASDGEASSASGQKADFSVTTAGVYLSARTTGPIYAIGRIGVAKTEIDFGTNSGQADLDDSGIAVGAGIGFSTGLRTELELTSYEFDKEQAYYLSLGLAF
jgi:hypothetical protein